MAECPPLYDSVSEDKDLVQIDVATDEEPYHSSSEEFTPIPSTRNWQPLRKVNAPIPTPRTGDDTRLSSTH